MDGTGVSAATFNGISLTSIIFNGTTVWTADTPHGGATVYASGSVSIPALVTSISFSGQGESGYDNSYWIPATYQWVADAAAYQVGGGSTNDLNAPTSNSIATDNPPTGAGQTCSNYQWIYIGRETVEPYQYLWYYYRQDFTAAVDVAGHYAGDSYYAAGTTTSTISGTTRTCPAGGYSTATVTSFNNVALGGTGYTLSYTIAPGGYLTYSY